MFGGVVANRIANFYAGVILYFIVSVMRRSESWRGRLVLKFLTRQRLLPYISSGKRSALANSWDPMNVPARISITENAGWVSTQHGSGKTRRDTASRTASLGTTWYRANSLVSDGEGF